MTDEYMNAAIELKSYYDQNKEKYDSISEHYEDVIEQFKEEFSPEVLRNLKDSEVLNFIFGNVEDNSLFHNLEFGKDLERFGGIRGGYAGKRILFKAKNSNVWKDSKTNEITEEEASKQALYIKDLILKACDYISTIELKTIEDYIKLDGKLYEILGNYTHFVFIRKYLFLLFPDLFFPIYKESLLKSMLYKMSVLPRDNYYELLGQMHLIKQSSNIPDFAFIEIIGDKLKYNELNFFQLDLSNEPEDLLKIGKEKGFLTLNCQVKKNFSDLNESDLKAVLNEENPGIDNRTFNEINRFMNPGADPIFVIKRNGKLIGLFGEIGEYEYDPESSYPHQRKGKWIVNFSQDEELPNNENRIKLTNNENLLFLYNRYFNSYSLDLDNDVEDINIVNEDKVEQKIRFKTGFKSKYPRNLLLYGAPGTGKSFRLNQQREDLLDSENDYERVTFYPDYSYANFVGTYKPTMDKNTNSLTYKFVPGPFARIYAKAIKNSITDEIHPYLLIIEELNRANAAAVFGDVFQLLDRIDNVSEYPVTTSEEFRNYLIEEVGGDETDFEIIRLPDNLFIWATMNNADQGVNPIDTAFKRRWGYQSLDIDENDNQIAGKYVLLGQYKEQKIEWNKLRKAINEFLSKERINEDKQLGPFFLNLNEFEFEGNQIDSESFIEAFKNKILSYLYEDAARRIRQKLFSGSQKNYRFSDLCEDFNRRGIKIFDSEIIRQTEPEYTISE